MNLRCRLGFHKWKWAPYYRRSIFFSTFRYRYCVRCPKIQQVYESVVGYVLARDIEGIPMYLFTGQEEDQGVIISSGFEDLKS